MAMVIPVISVAGVVLGALLLERRARRLRRQGFDAAAIEAMLFQPPEDTKPNWWIFGGSLVFVAFTLAMGLGEVPFAQEIVFAGSMGIVCFLIYRLLLEFDHVVRLAFVGTAIIVFVYRAMPLPGPGLTWFQIDVLGFDQQFLAVLTLITSLLALAGMLIFRPLIATHSIAYIVALLSVASGVLALPDIGLYYGLHHWTAALTGGVVDARFIAILDTAIESPLPQIAMIPMLAWIAQNAPAHLKATFFAVMASFVNLALSANNLGTKYANEIFLVTREVRDRDTGAIKVAADYSELGWLLIAIAVIELCVPLVVILFVQRSRLRTTQ
jgi:hypothetical protein